MNKNKSLPELAKSLMRVEAKRVVPRGGSDGEVITCSMSEMLDQLPETLFEGLAPDREERAELFGFGNEHIDVAFNSVRNGLRQLARTGRCDPEVFSEGEHTLKDLIRGVSEAEREAKQGINPNVTTKYIEISRLLNYRSLHTPVSPNEIDTEQAEFLFVYQQCRYARLALEEILTTVRQINQALEEGPGKAPHTPSR